MTRTDLLADPAVKANVANVRDITERRKTSEALRASETRFARLAESGIIGVLTADVHGRVVEVNDAYRGAGGMRLEGARPGSEPEQRNDVIVQEGDEGSGSRVAFRTFSLSEGAHVQLGAITLAPPQQGSYGLSATAGSDDVLVTAVVPAGAAAQAGIHAGDRIVAMMGAQIGSGAAQVTEVLVGSATVGQPVTVGLERDHLTVMMTAAPTPASSP
jgi:membrane-associated protease RseP (regulator of RpoE activity)